jgi:aldose 1-epimerase
MKATFKIGILTLISLVLFSCIEKNKDSIYSEQDLELLLPNASLFSDTVEGKETKLYTLKNETGLIASITNYGGRVVGLIVPDAMRNPIDVVIGMKSLKAYEESSEPYYGALIGRVGNRIANGKFILDGKTYELSTNNGGNTLHGGIKGYQSVVWKADQPNDSTLILKHISMDGDQGFPGELTIKVTYTVTKHQGLKVEYEATTNQSTVVNLTNHAFFNLNGEGSGNVNDHLLMINADSYTPVDSTLIPFGTIEKVEDTPFDFRKPTTIGERINNESLQLQYGLGYDHNYALNKDENVPYNHAARVIGEKSKIFMDVYTTEPGLQFYGGNFMQGMNTLKSSVKDEHRTAFCLETQHFPDAPNQPNFPSIRLNPGEVYKTVSAYVFSIAD